MILQRDYLKDASKYESIFRAILRDFISRARHNKIIPEEIDVESNLEELFRTYSSGERNGLFSILDFQVFNDRAIIAFENIDYHSKGGSGVEIRHRIKSPDSVEYDTDLMDWQIKL
ncbi:MAG: hypothetical protein AABX07_00545 [Nanoarchaeota archaeon]